jgi:hypothetical protein
MSRRQYADEDLDEAADRRHAEEVQTGIDDAAEAKRNAAGVSPEVLSLQDAAIEGARAGHLGLSASLNPYQAGCEEHDVWERARSCVIGAYLNNLRRVA